MSLSFPTNINQRSSSPNSSFGFVAPADTTPDDSSQVLEYLVVDTSASAQSNTQIPPSANGTTTSTSYTSKNFTPVTKMKSNKLRWAIYGIVTELFHNIFIRQLNKGKRRTLTNGRQIRQPPNNEIAVVTGATGGIGSQIAHGLAFRGYDVVIAARDIKRGNELMNEIQTKLAESPVNSTSRNEAVPVISFVEYHADKPQSALDVASSVQSLVKEDGSGTKRQLTVLINNAGIMGKEKPFTMRVNLIGPVLLTLSLLPLLNDTTNDGKLNNVSAPTVINVGSSAHLRATQVIDNDIPLNENDSYIDNLPGIPDSDLSTYGQSKLALMQFSTLLRRWQPQSGNAVHIQDAHPGLVWTPLLRNHIGEKVTNTLQRSGLAKLIYKTPEEGAQSILASLDYAQRQSTATTDASSRQQLYFVNGKPCGYGAAKESRDIDASIQLWKEVIGPELKGVVSLPDGWGEG